MVRITEELVRKRAEHNECEISTLEEVSLHQQDIERIEHLDKWCRELKILYLQSNLIPKIENVSRLKKLEYLNLALNNVERIENLEGCESLKKLDLTVNFVGELTSVESLKGNHHLEEIYLTGNPCSDYEGYREYVTAALPQLKVLDGREIEKSERIKAIQNFGVVRARIIQQQEEYKKKRAKEKQEAEEKRREKERKQSVPEEVKSHGNKCKPGFDGRWYTDINERDKKVSFKEHEEKVHDFWQEKVPYTPESRIDMHNHLKELKEKEEKKDDREIKKARRLFSEDGRPLNINESKIEFTLMEDDENNYILDLAIFRYMDTSLLECDVQPEYVRVVLKGKLFQLSLSEEVNAEKSTAKRSQTTGHLVITMPKVKQTLKLNQCGTAGTKPLPETQEQGRNKRNHELLEVDERSQSKVDISSIVQEKSECVLQPLGVWRNKAKEERPNSQHFIDNPDVPPLI